MKIPLCGLNINGVVHQRTCKCTLQTWVGTVKDCRQIRQEQQQTWCSCRRRQMTLDHICSGVSHNIRRVFGLRSIVPSSPLLEREGQEALVNIVTPYFSHVCHNVMLTGHLDMRKLLNELINKSMSVTWNKQDDASNHFHQSRNHFEDNTVDHQFSFSAFVSVTTYASVVLLEASSSILAVDAKRQREKVCCRLQRSAGFHRRRNHVGTLVHPVSGGMRHSPEKQMNRNSGTAEASLRL